MQKNVPIAAKRYAKELAQEVNQDREKHGKKPFENDDDQPSKTKETIQSTTDPESGVFHKGEHRKCFAYEAHTACDLNNLVLGVNVTPGNIHDSVAFDDLYDYICRYFPDHEVVVADSAYKTPYICKTIFDSNRVLSTAYKRPMTRKGGHKWYEYVYDEYYDCVICPEYQILKYRTTNREGYREYKSKPYIRCCFDVGYISDDEAWSYINNARQTSKEHYRSWKEFASGYVIGRAMWSGNTMSLTGIITIAQSLLDDEESPWKQCAF